ncbi:AAA family ATPase [Nosocomiicoccus ampullae]|uniref:AAA family ATPase n=1 Tax=Nosocomiicoccus ampullae TaxID=489910 RepID=UPI00254AB063|nr:AAA family ATPase [Nosocomiicoccus ampullae]MDK6862962.1 AAA family ATPase [Nosocomiicoccus ampullae]
MKILLVKGNIKEFYEKHDTNSMFDLNQIIEMLKETDSTDRIKKMLPDDNSDYFLRAGDIRRFYSSFAEAFSGFILFLDKIRKINNIYLINPTFTLEHNLKKELGKFIVDKVYSYKNISNVSLVESYIWLKNNKIYGQNNALKSIHSSLIDYLDDKSCKVFLLYGPSGVGKTETIKSFHDIIHPDDKLTRVQFSMLNDEEGVEYVFGNDSSKKSFAEELLNRESNIILLDEFDKCHPHLYNSFYQMFDENKFKNNNYEIDLSNLIVFCTSNFSSLEDIKSRVGSPLYGRFTQIIKYDQINMFEQNRLLEKYIDEFYDKLNTEQKLEIPVEIIKNKLNDYLKPGLNAREIKREIRRVLNRYLFNIELKKYNTHTLPTSKKFNT